MPGQSSVLVRLVCLADDWYQQCNVNDHCSQTCIWFHVIAWSPHIPGMGGATGGGRGTCPPAAPTGLLVAALLLCPHAAPHCGPHSKNPNGLMSRRIESAIFEPFYRVYMCLFVRGRFWRRGRRLMHWRR